MSLDEMYFHALEALMEAWPRERPEWRKQLQELEGKLGTPQFAVAFHHMLRTMGIDEIRFDFPDGRVEKRRRLHG